MDIGRIHTPVMLERTLALLAPAIEADATTTIDRPARSRPPRASTGTA